MKWVLCLRLIVYRFELYIAWSPSQVHLFGSYSTLGTTGYNWGAKGGRHLWSQRTVGSSASCLRIVRHFIDWEADRSLLWWTYSYYKPIGVWLPWYQLKSAGTRSKVSAASFRLLFSRRWLILKVFFLLLVPWLVDLAGWLFKLDVLSMCVCVGDRLIICY